MHFTYVLRNLKTKKLFIGCSDNFSEEFKKNKNSVLVSVKTYKDKKEAQKSEKYLKSEKGLTELKIKIKKKALGILA